MFSRLYFSWVTPILVRGKESPHTLESLVQIFPEDRSEVSFADLKEQLEKRGTHRRGLTRSIIAVSAPAVLKSFFLMFLHVNGQLVAALILRHLLMLLSTGSADPLFGFINLNSPLFAALLLFLCTIVITLSVHHLFMTLLRCANRVRSALTALVYAKALRLSLASREQFPSGRIMNMVANDLYRVYWAIVHFHSFMGHPYQIVLIVVLLYMLLGWGALVGASTLVLFMGLSALISRLNLTIRKQQLETADKRLALINELLVHIRTVKLCGWEDGFLGRIRELRLKEAGFLRRIALILVCSTAIFQATPTVVAAATFVTLYFSTGLPSVPNIFAGLFLFSLLRWGLNLLPEAIISLYESRLALGRISEFLEASEHHGLPIDSVLQRGQITCAALSADWKNGSPALREVNLQVERGELVCIVGPIGAGKSALLSALLGDLEVNTGVVSLNGSVAYVPQQAWILSATVRENIVLGTEFDQMRYDRMIDLSGLRSDIQSFPAADSTQIGERGINLSGGQKQRLSLARAAYVDADIFLLDDPLSALDSKVGGDVFRNLIHGELKGKTRILVTHRLEYVEGADKVVLIHEGTIQEIVSVKEFRSRKEFIQRISQRSTDEAAPPQSPDAAMLVLREEEEGSIEGELERAPHVSGALIEQEERYTGSITPQTLRFYRSAFAPGFLLFLILLIFPIRDGFTLLSDYVLARWALGETLYGFNSLYLYGACVVSVVLVSIFRAAIVRLRGLAAGSRMHEGLLRSVFAAPMRFFESTPVGRIVNRFSGDMDMVDNTIPPSLSDALSSAATTVVGIFVIVWVNPVIFLGLVPLGLLYFHFQGLFRPTSREGQRLDSISKSPIYAQYSETLVGLSVIRAFSWGAMFQSNLLKSIDRNLRCNFSIVCSNRWLGVRLELIGSALTLASAALPALSSGAVSSVAAGLAVTYSMTLSGSLNWLVRMFTQVESGMSSVERISYYSQLPSERWDGVEPERSWPHSGLVEIKQISARYRPELPDVLSNLSVQVQSGMRLGVVGRTGSGKSTMVLCLSRLLELSHGQILIDNIDIATIPLKRLRSELAIIPQDPVMFAGTIRENLDPLGSYSDEVLWSALRRTHLADFISALPDTLGFIVTEWGTNLSVGQRQLVCLARALVRGCRILVLDEATANVDTETDTLVQETIRTEFKGCTVITIAHRLNTILDYDRVMVLEQGRVVEVGAPYELIRRTSSLFRNMVMIEQQRS